MPKHLALTFCVILCAHNYALSRALSAFEKKDFGAGLFYRRIFASQNSGGPPRQGTLRPCEALGPPRSDGPVASGASAESNGGM